MPIMARRSACGPQRVRFGIKPITVAAAATLSASAAIASAQTPSCAPTGWTRRSGARSKACCAIRPGSRRNTNGASRTRGSGVRTVQISRQHRLCRRTPRSPRTASLRDLRLPRFHPHLWCETRHSELHRAAPDRGETDGDAESNPGKPDAKTACSDRRRRRLAQERRSGLPELPCCAGQPETVGHVPGRGMSSMDARPPAAQPEIAHDLGKVQAFGYTIHPRGPNTTFLSEPTLRVMTQGRSRMR